MDRVMRRTKEVRRLFAASRQWLFAPRFLSLLTLLIVVLPLESKALP